MAHRLSHIIPIYGPYMSHTTQFGKGFSVAVDLNESDSLFCTIARFSCMVAFLIDTRLVFRSSLSNQQIHFDCCQFQSDIKQFLHLLSVF